MLRSVEVFGGVFVLGVIAAADVTAGEAEAKVYPRISHLETFLTSIRRLGCNVFDLIKMRALFIHFSSCRVQEMSACIS